MLKLPIGVDINNLIYDLKNFSWEASEILLDYSQKLKKTKHRKDLIKSKEKEDPVTIADLKVNELIIKGIKEKYKNVIWEILSEENVKIGSDNVDLNAKWLWVLDPLDGTKDFIQGTGNYAMHLALNYLNQSLIGVVLIPERNELWISNGEEVFCERRDGSILKANLSLNRSLEDMTIVTSKNHRNKNLEYLIKKIDFREKIVMGSIGCKIASIIRGESDIYISMSMPGKSCPKDWDFAAPEAVLKAAGGAITNLENEELTYRDPFFEQGGVIIASNNKENHKIICLQIKEIIEKYDIYPLNSN